MPKLAFTLMKIGRLFESFLPMVGTRTEGRVYMIKFPGRIDCGKFYMGRFPQVLSARILLYSSVLGLIEIGVEQ